MNDTVRVGMIGTSYWADFMLQWLTSHPQAVPAAVCGRQRPRAEEVAAKFAIPRVYTDYREMLAQGGLDAVIIATPDDEHYPMAMAALDAGLHVLGEKPMALNLPQARAMLAKAEAAGVKHMLNYSWRFLPHFRYLRQLVAGGFVGQVYDAHFRYLRPPVPSPERGAGGDRGECRGARRHGSVRLPARGGRDAEGR
jgi:predicted dehydrogenase